MTCWCGQRTTHLLLSAQYFFYYFTFTFNLIQQNKNKAIFDILRVDRIDVRLFLLYIDTGTVVVLRVEHLRLGAICVAYRWAMVFPTRNEPFRNDT
jgi:hypothetical protein